MNFDGSYTSCFKTRVLFSKLHCFSLDNQSQNSIVELSSSTSIFTRVSYERDTKIISAASFTIEREDHTIGNILRMQLHRDPNVLFAGYKLPHPLQYKILVRIHTTSQSSPTQAYNQAINDLDKELDCLKSAFEAEVARFTTSDF
ncbi:hypothetical protein KSS87_001242 [Heliosperma pusillum]|nr:hypothetical protein KSS87_007169 [Heliosperma pusillum]KAH9627403.1 hypothetical protein KSS87_001242 [Heliosperma pusillum]